MERTFAIIKPDAVAAGSVGPILARITEEGFQVIGMRMLRMSRHDAEGFYAVHSERPFFNDLTSFMSSGPCVVLAMTRDDAIAHWRTTMGATNPAEAAEGTLRKLFATDIEKNAVHGSDAPETAAQELSYFFRDVDLRV